MTGSLSALAATAGFRGRKVVARRRGCRLFYALILHLRLKGVRWDRTTAWLGIAGVFVMPFTYMGVSMLMKSSHSF